MEDNIERKQETEKRFEAIVPIYQIQCIGGVEVPLANAKMYSEDARDRHSYLKFQVTGDNDKRLEQVEYEVERAFQVLRFIAPWYETDDKSYNAAHHVSMWRHTNRNIVHLPISATNGSTHGYVDILEKQSETQPFCIPFFPALLHHAKHSCSLDSINYHFRNHDRYDVSRRFCRAFEFYDIASRSSDAAVALASFVMCIDMLLPSDNPKWKKLTDFLISLIEYGDRYEGIMTRNEDKSGSNSTGWAKSVALTVGDYKEFYIIRDKVVHGNTMSRIVSGAQVNKSRQIAKNAIMAYARLSQALKWQSDKDAKRWFKNPRSA